jgi:flagellar motor switch protein FliN
MQNSGMHEDFGNASMPGDADSDRVDEGRINLVLDIPIEVTVEIGRRKMLLGEVVRLGPGAIVELGKASGEPLDILANGHLIARGEAVVIGERYGVRVMDIVSSQDRIAGLAGGEQEEL